MVTVLLLDVSLSMCRTVKNLLGRDASQQQQHGEQLEVKQLANVGIGTLLDYFAQNAQLENTALLVFSSLWEVRHEFTRNYESIKNGIYDLELYDKSNIVNAIRGALTLNIHQYADYEIVNMILITDGQAYHETMCNSSSSDDDDDDNHNENDADADRSDTDTGDQEECDDFDDTPLSELKGEYEFPCKLQIAVISPPQAPCLKYSLPFYKKLISIVDKSMKGDCPVITGSSEPKVMGKSAIWLPETDEMDGISVESVDRMFMKMAETHYKPFNVHLTCGNMSSLIMLSPKPSDNLQEPLKNEFDELRSEKNQGRETFASAMNKSRLYKLNNEINICGFLSASETGSPTAISRHAIMPFVNNSLSETAKAEKILSQDPGAYINKTILQMTGEISGTDNVTLGNSKAQAIETAPNSKASSKQSTSDNSTSEQDITKQPSFCALLHNALKQENMVAICIVGQSDDEAKDDWFGMIYAFTKRKSCLLLSLLTPGPAPIQWLPKIRELGSAQLNSDLPQAIRDKMMAETGGSAKSYSLNNISWPNSNSVQSDIQKIVRYVKRAPEKAPNFYKELNKVRRLAISYGFYDLLLGIASILEREKRIMLMDQNKGLNQEALKHIDHAVACLRSPLHEGSYDNNIAPIT